MHLIFYLLIITLLASHGKNSLAVSVNSNEIRLPIDRSAQCDPAGVCPKIECGSSEIKVSLLVNELQAMKVDIENIHLLDRSCRGFLNIDGILYITMTPGEGVCGTVLTTSETHATYRNTIFLPPHPDAIVYRELLNINVACTYSLKQLSVSDSS